MGLTSDVLMVDEFTGPLWRGGERGELVLAGCEDCGRFVHPPGPVCPYCWSGSLRPAAVSGQATLYAFTVNRLAWPGGPPPPYVLGVVQLVEQDDLYLATALREAPDDPGLVIGAPVVVGFEQVGDGCYLPVFRLARSAVAGEGP
jgi:uncharacterized OB-fold protein